MKNKMGNITIASVHFSAVFLLLILFGAIQIDCQMDRRTAATPGLFSSQVAILKLNIFRCGGGIIDATHVLTTAYCVADAPECMLTVKGGIIDLGDDHAIERDVTRIQVHPNYATEFINPQTGQKYTLAHSTNDIAVLTLDGPLEADNIGYMSFPNARVEATNYNCELCFFSGWGQIGRRQPIWNRLSYMKMIILTVRECRQLRKLPAGVNEFCALDFYRIRTASQGDAGGQLVCGGKAVGIAVSASGIQGDPVIFTSVHAHINFINHALGN